MGLLMETQQQGLGEYGKNRIREILATRNTPLTDAEKRLYSTLGVIPNNEQRPTK